MCIYNRIPYFAQLSQEWHKNDTRKFCWCGDRVVWIKLPFTTDKWTVSWKDLHSFWEVLTIYIFIWRINNLEQFHNIFFSLVWHFHNGYFNIFILLGAVKYRREGNKSSKQTISSDHLPAMWTLVIICLIKWASRANIIQTKYWNSPLLSECWEKKPMSYSCSKKCHWGYLWYVVITE